MTGSPPSSTSALETSVLVLNRHYMAVHIVSARRAFILLCKELAEVIDAEEGSWQSYDFLSWRELSEARRASPSPDEDWVRTVTTSIRVPRIVRLLGYDRLPKQTVKFNRRNLFARDESRCQYCGKRFPTQELTLDHVKPRTLGGQTTWENIVCACVDCNVRKGGRTPEQAKMKLIRAPYRPKTSPLVDLKLSSRKYHSWRAFIDAAYWTVELK
jgi:5-methylcytosine-specific restriction endonuclease McrA